jgi:hypothetical protein
LVQQLFLFSCRLNALHRLRWQRISKELIHRSRVPARCL